MDSNLTYTQSMQELESIVQKMQSEDCDIDQLADLTERALKLLKICQEKLFVTDDKIKRSLEELNHASNQQPDI